VNELGRSHQRLRARAATVVRVRLSARAKRGVRRGVTLKATLAITAVDAAGNRAARTTTVTIRAD
jgi:hypothetical protein